MTPAFCKSVCTLMAAALLLLGAGATHANQEAELKKLQENIQALQQELKNIRDARSNLQQELEQTESEMSDLLKNIERIQEQLKQQNQELKKLETERNQLEEARQEQQKQIGDQLRTAYQMGQQSQIKMLLNQESPERLTRLFGYHERLMHYQQEKLQRYQVTLDQLEQLEARILAQRNSLAQHQTQLASQQKALQQRQTSRQQTLAKINSSLNSKDAELRQLEEDKNRLQRLIKEVALAASKMPMQEGGSFSMRKGQMPWPTKGRLLSRFGSPRLEGTRWNGMLIGAAAGEAVVAIHSGRVVFADYFRGHGLLIIVDHGEGYLSLYAHNQHLLKTTGDWVAGGEAIARVGNTGGQQQMGLYFEIRHQGQPTDPGVWLAKA